jgi:hypothetical protein
VPPTCKKRQTLRDTADPVILQTIQVFLKDLVTLYMMVVVEDMEEVANLVIVTLMPHLDAMWMSGKLALVAFSSVTDGSVLHHIQHCTQEKAHRQMQDD